MKTIPDEGKAETLISWLLRIGVAVSGVLVVAGILFSFQHHPSYRSSPTDLARLTNIGSLYPHSLPTVASELRHGRGEGLAMLGLLLLIAIPVLRVAVSIVVFLIERDWVFVAITTTVLALLLLSFALGAAGA